ncbi:MAG: cell envelope integrity protein TolA [Sphingobacteriales bacterium]
MAFKFLKLKRNKLGLKILVAFVTIFLILAFFINLYWSPILAKKVRDTVLNSTDSLYKVNFSKAELHILQGNIILYNIAIEPDTAIYNRMCREHRAPNNLIELHVRRLILTSIHPFKLYFKHKLDIAEVVLNDPSLHLTYRLNQTKDTVKKDNRTLWQQISKSLKSVHIGNIFLNDVKLKYDDFSGNKLVISELKEMSFSARDLLIDSATQQDKSRLLYCKEIIAELNNYKGKSADGLYAYKIDHIKLSTLTSQVNIKGLSLEPVNSKTFFNRTKLDRYSVQLDSLQLNHFDYLAYHRFRTFSVSSIVAKNGALILSNNPNKKSNPSADKISSFPARALSEITTDIRVDTVLVRNIDVSYSEYNDKSYQTGTISFDHTSGRLLNITNNKLALAKNNISTAQLSTYFMNRGKLVLSFNQNMTDPNAIYSYKGELGPMEMGALNRATMALAMVKITNGSIKKFSFDINGNSKASKGKVVLLYNDLKVKLLDPDTNFNGYSGKLVASLYANIFVIKHNNPDNANEAPRMFYVNYKRPKSSPFFKTIWNTLLTGIKPAAGLDEKTQKATEAKMAEAETDKQVRLTKKQARLKRRADRKAKRALRKAQKQAQKLAEHKATKPGPAI